MHDELMPASRRTLRQISTYQQSERGGDLSYESNVAALLYKLTPTVRGTTSIRHQAGVDATSTAVAGIFSGVQSCNILSTLMYNTNILVRGGDISAR
jgi:hypothetical protein